MDQLLRQGRVRISEVGDLSAQAGDLSVPGRDGAVQRGFFAVETGYRGIRRRQGGIRCVQFGFVHLIPADTRPGGHRRPTGKGRDDRSPRGGRQVTAPLGNQRW